MARAKTILVGEVKVGTRHRKDLGDLGTLAQSIEAEGLLQPIGVTPDSKLIFGQRRLKAVEQLGWDRIPALVINISSIAAGEYAENEIRKDFMLSERDAIRRTLEGQMPERRGGDTSTGEQSIPANLPECKGKETREITAKQAGFSSTHEARAVRIVTAKGTPALVKAMDEDTLPVSVAAKIAELPKDKQNKIAKAANPRAAARAALSTPTPPIKDGLNVFWRRVKELSERFDSIIRQYGSLTKMFRDPNWPGDAHHVSDIIHELHKMFERFDKEAQEYAKKHKG
ncbi:MAG TPA: ParB N-terminal domain-containing protein [Thermoguttaceae bacterium]|nr:ParB N-terminal domain-containing protein [Thermoguttaceae bacterium]